MLKWKDDPERRKAYHKERLRKKNEYLNSLRDQPCHDCKLSWPVYVMEFDHVPERGKKRFTLANGGNWALNGKLMQEELAKCDVVCANCHKVRTYKRIQAGLV